jgi:hypothetical protein
VIGGTFAPFRRFASMNNPEKDKDMASSARQKPLILTAAEADLQRAEARAEANARLAEWQVKPSRRGSALAYIVAALVLLAGYLWFSGTWNTTPVLPTVTETIPSPDIDSTVAPGPPAPQTTPPPADAPATNP